MAKRRTPTVQLRKPPRADVESFVAAQEHTGTSTPKRKRAAAQERARLHCFLPAGLHQWLGVQAVVQKRDMGEIVAEALERLRAATK